MTYPSGPDAGLAGQSDGRKGLTVSPLKNHRFILILLGIGLIAGVVLGNDYGMSYDELVNAQVGEAALSTYLGSRAYFSTADRADHGPVYFMIFAASGNLIHEVIPGWTAPDGRHLTNYLTFLLAIWLLYLSCLRLMRRASATITAALFASQPLLFGYAFIDQKDIPFMALFLATIYLAMSAADGLLKSPAPEKSQAGLVLPPEAATWFQAASAEWRSAGTASKVVPLAVSVLLVAFILDSLVIGGLARLAHSLLAAAYAGTAPAPVQAIYLRIATDAYKTSLAQYQAKLDLFLAYARYLGAFALLVAAAVAWSRVLPSLGRALGFSRRAALNPKLMLAAVAFGATICVRQVGLFAGGLAGLYLLVKLRQRAAFPLVVFSVLGAAVTYVTWPFLWGDPLGRYVGSITRAVEFPAHDVLFLGQQIPSSQLPWFYFPLLSGLRLTEPAVLLIGLGALVLIQRLVLHHSGFTASHAILLLWIGVPVLMLLLSVLSAYGIRQLLFLMPPMFILAGLAVDVILGWVPNPRMRAILIAVALLPGVWANISLHPYEYVYFNTFTGGVRGAEGVYGLDTWCISLRAGIEEVNQIAAPGSVVMVSENPGMVAPFARPDLVLTDSMTAYPRIDYIMRCAYRTTTLNLEKFSRVYEVTRGGARLALVWKRDSGS